MYNDVHQHSAVTKLITTAPTNTASRGRIMDVAIVLTFFLSFLIFYKLIQKKRKLPPGIYSFPIAGALPWMMIKKQSLIEIVKDDRKLYGNISRFPVFNFEIVVLNDAKLIKEMVGMEQCGGRMGRMSEWKSGGRPRGLLDPDNTPFWKEQRRFVLKCLRDYGFGKKSEENIQEEAKSLVNHIFETNDSQQDFYIKDIFNISVVNVIWKMVANETFALDSKEGKRFVEIMEQVLTNRDPKASIPVLGKFTTVFRNRVKQISEIKAGLMKTINDHELSLDEAEPRDLIDNYLLAIREGKEGFVKEELVVTIFDLFAAGSETTSTTLRWAIIFLILNPETQRKCHRELDKIDSRIPGLTDMSLLPYCEAVILEVLRVGCTAPGTLPHKSHQNLELGGYTFPSQTLFIGNFMSTHFDPEYWSEPQQFMPERFLDGDGKIIKELPNFFPFSLGKRVCLGESLAKMELFIFFTSILKSFKFSLPENHPVPNPEDFNIVVTKIPKPYFCKIEERL